MPAGVNLAAHTVNGKVEIDDLQGNVEAATVNGSIDLTMPRNVDADLAARSMNGHIVSDFPITASGRITSRRLMGSIGNGGPKLRMETINGGIELHSSGDTFQINHTN